MAWHMNGTSALPQPASERQMRNLKPARSDSVRSHWHVVLPWLALFCMGAARANPDLPVNRPEATAPASLADWKKWPASVRGGDDMPPLLLTSVQLTQLPLAHLLQALSQQEGLSFDVDECGAIPLTLSQKNIELTDLLDRIADLARIRYHLTGSAISVRCDQPYSRNYPVDYPGIDRFSQSLSGTSGGQFAASASGGAGGLQTGGAGLGALSNGSTQLQTRHQNRYWEQLIPALESILAADEELSEPVRITETELSRTEQGALLPGGERRTTGAANGSRAAPINGSLDSNINKTTTSRTEQRRRQVIAHTESGLVHVRANARQHRQIEQFLVQSSLRARQQVEVEATLLEIRLSDNFQSGIQWTDVRGDRTLSLMPTVALTGGRSGLIFTNPASGGNGLGFAIRLLEQFGAVRVLSNPRVAILNQQTALLKMVENRVFFTVSAQAVPAGPNSGAFSTFSTQAHSVPVGFVMSVTPHIEDRQAVTLNLKPSLSRIVGFVSDPNPSLVEAGVQSRVPEIQTREIESVLRLKSGEIALLGGFIQTEMRQGEEGIAGLMDRPLTAWLTGSKERERQFTELVVLVRPWVTPAGARP
jgi:general secretion pathway protein D